jgi:hypothetical protein
MCVTTVHVPTGREREALHRSKSFWQFQGPALLQMSVVSGRLCVVRVNRIMILGLRCFGRLLVVTENTPGENMRDFLVGSPVLAKSLS